MRLAGAIVVGALLGTLLVLIVFSFARMGWRILRGEDEFVAGGSMGRQMTSPVESKHRIRRLQRWLFH
jgi:hypothetical protein